MKKSLLRALIPLAILVIAGVGFVLHTGFGNLSAIGWGSVSVLCPLGALTTMLASKTVVPKALISLGIGVVIILVFGRAFCGWVCPVPVISKLRGIAKGKRAATDGGSEAPVAPLTDAEKKILSGAKGGCGSCTTCSGMALEPGRKLDSRHLVLLGALASTAVFGFPVFCLICPIGLTFATVFLVIMLFGGGDVTWSVVLVPALLVLEVVFFRKWCGKICPLGALMSLISKGNKTLRPQADPKACLVTSRGAHCSKCAEACPVGIDLHHPERVSASECIKCGACVDACPVGAITIPFMAKRESADAPAAEGATGE